MDSSTITFVATLVVAFIFLRWFISPGIPSVEAPESESTRPRRSAAPSSSTTSTQQNTQQAQQRRVRRPVTQDMIEVVLTIAPHLTPSQIRYDLESTGSVQTTVDRYLSTGNLPYPPGESPEELRAAADARRSSGKKSLAEPVNLIEKYGLQHNVNKDVDEIDDSNLSDYEKKRQVMILQARRRLAQQLKDPKF